MHLKYEKGLKTEENKFLIFWKLFIIVQKNFGQMKSF